MNGPISSLFTRFPAKEFFKRWEKSFDKSFRFENEFFFSSSGVEFVERSSRLFVNRSNVVTRRIDRQRRLSSRFFFTLLRTTKRSTCLYLAVIKCAEKYSDFVIGFISQSRLKTKNEFFHCTPGRKAFFFSIFQYFSSFYLGIHLNNTGDQLGQQYVSPRQAIDGRGADILIVGRAILDSLNRVQTAEEYRDECFRVYEQFRFHRRE